MSDPRHTDPRPDRATRDPNLRPSSAPMWVWIGGIAVVVVIAFALAAGWSSDTQTADNAPPATVGSGGATIPPASTTGSGATDSGTTGRAPATRPTEPATTPDRPAATDRPASNSGAN